MLLTVFSPDNTGLAIRNLAFNLLSLGCRLAGNMVIFIVIARLPGIETADFGQLTYAVALTSIFIQFSQFGLLPLVVREIGVDHFLLANYARTALPLRIVLSLIGLAFLFAYLQHTDMTQQGRLVCYIMAFALYIGSFSTDFQALFFSRKLMYFELIGIVAENILIFFLSLLAFWFHANIVQIAYIFLLAKLVALVINYLVCGRFLMWVYPRIDIKLWKRMLVEAMPFALVGVITSGIVQLDTVLIRELSPKDPEIAVGIYQAAVLLFLFPMLLPEIVLKGFFPQLSRMNVHQGSGLTRDLGSVNHILLTLGLLISLVTVFRGGDLIRLIYGEKFVDAGPLLQVLGLTIMMRFGAAYNLYFIIRNRIWLRVFAAIVALSAVVILNSILIPRYGPMGAAYASVIAHIIYWIPYLAALYISERTVAMGWNILRAGAAGILVSAFLYATSEFHLLYMGPIYMASIILAVFLTMRREDRNKILYQFNGKQTPPLIERQAIIRGDSHHVKTASLLHLGHLFILPILLVGSGMQGYANGAPEALLVAFLLLLVGLALVSLMFQNKRAELLAFMATYAVCVFAGGLAQCYSLTVFNNPQSTTDALYGFFPYISAQPPFMTLEDMPLHNSPMAVVIWQQVYKLAWWLGLKFGPYTGVMLNAFVMGLTGSLTVRTAREIFGSDDRRLRLVAILFAFNGLFILFGAVLIRDCFPTFLNALLLWRIVRWLVHPTLRNLLLASAILGVTVFAMFYLRAQAAQLFGLYGVLAFLFWIRAKRLDTVRLVAILFAMGMVVIATPYLLAYFDLVSETQGSGMENYDERSSSDSMGDSLGMRLVINQPPPIRMVVGTGLLMIYPIPLWSYFTSNSTDYAWIKGYNGIYQILVMPLVIAGFSMIFLQYKKDRYRVTPLSFLAVYLLMNTAAVVLTSIEQRHLAQFMPAFIILAALPDMQDKRVRKRLRVIMIGWMVVVALVHLAWLLLKG